MKRTVNFTSLIHKLKMGETEFSRANLKLILNIPYVELGEVLLILKSEGCIVPSKRNRSLFHVDANKLAQFYNKSRSKR